MRVGWCSIAVLEAFTDEFITFASTRMACCSDALTRHTAHSSVFDWHAVEVVLVAAALMSLVYVWLRGRVDSKPKLL